MIHSGGVIVTPVQFNPFEDVNKQLVDIEETDVKLEGKQLQCGVNVDKIISTLLAFRVQLTEHFNFRQSNSITIRIVLHAGTNYLSKSALLTVPADKELLKKQFLVVGIVGKACEWKVKTQNDGIAVISREMADKSTGLKTTSSTSLEHVRIQVKRTIVMKTPNSLTRQEVMPLAQFREHYLHDHTCWPIVGVSECSYLDVDRKHTSFNVGTRDKQWDFKFVFAQKHLSPPSGTTPSDVPALTPDHNASDEASTAPSTEQSTVPITALRTAPSATPHGLPSFSSDSTSLGSLLSPPTERFDISDPGHDHLTQPPDNISTTASDAEQLHPQELTDVNATPFRPIRPLPATATTTGTNKRPASSNPSLPQESLINKRLDHGNYNPQPLPQFAFQTPYMHYPPPPYFAYNGPFHPPPFYPNAFYPNPYGMTSAPSMYAGPYVPFTQAQSRTPLGEVSGNSMSRWREVKTEGKNVVVIDDDDSERDSKPRL